MLQKGLLTLIACACVLAPTPTLQDAAAQDTGQEQQAVTDSKEKQPDVIYVPTPQEVVNLMLGLADIKSTDLMYDLGCGDGRIVVTAAKKYGCKAIGVDIDPQRIQESLANVQAANVGDLVTIEHNDIFELDLSEADVVTLYLLPDLNVKLLPQLQKMKPGSRIVSHSFDIEGMVPDARVTISGRTVRNTDVYLWTIPFTKAAETNPQPVLTPVVLDQDRSFIRTAASYVYHSVPLLVTLAALILAAPLWLLRNRLGEIRIKVSIDRPTDPSHPVR